MIVDIYAAALSVKQLPATVRKWVSRGELTHHGYDRKRRVIVDLEELQALVAAKQATQSHNELDQPADLLSHSPHVHHVPKRTPQTA